MDYLPIFLDMRDSPCLLVGGGPVALRKLVRLQQKLEAYDAEADDDLRDIIKLAGTSTFTAQLKKLAKRLDQYDFEGGLLIISEIIEDLPNG